MSISQPLRSHPSDTSRVAFANSLRGVAAISVIVSHYCGAFWNYRDVVEQLTNMPALADPPIGTPVYVEALSHVPHLQWGPFGVAIFFLVSGFVVPFSLLHFTRPQFLISRFFRIYPTYFVAFSITLLAIWSAGTVFERRFPYTMADVFIHYFPGARNLLWSRGIDGVAWTLEIEVSFYLICAILHPWINRVRSRLFAFPFALFVLSSIVSFILAPYGSAHAPLTKYLYGFCLNSSYLIFMFCGLVLNLVYRRLIGRAQATLLVAAYFAMSSVSFNVSLFADPSLPSSYGAALCIFVLCMVFPVLVTRIPAIDLVARISFPLYAVHGVAGYVLLNAALRSGLRASVSISLVFAAACVTAFVLHVTVERWSQFYGRRLARRLDDMLPVPVGRRAGGSARVPESLLSVGPSSEDPASPSRP